MKANASYNNMTVNTEPIKPTPSYCATQSFTYRPHTTNLNFWTQHVGINQPRNM